jgi:pimeloyl-ACP methyl ester carboxylesterase
MLPSLGYAVFVYDRRGSGKSGGDLAASDYALLADDAIAAVRMLKADPRMDPKRVGIWGQSQGGWIAVLAASRSAEVAFVVSVSAPVVTPDVQMIFYSTNSLRVNGYPQAEIDQMVATRKAVDAYMRGTGDRETAQRLVDAARGRPWFKLTYMGDTVKDRELSRRRREIEHDPMRTLEQVGVPALMIFGAVDPIVPVDISVQRLRGAAATHPEMRVVVIGGADHAMMTSLDPKTQMDPARVTQDDPESPVYFGVLAAWLIEQARRQALPACPS